nr:MAG: capsid protein [Chemarfal virus 108]
MGKLTVYVEDPLVAPSSVSSSVSVITEAYGASDMEFAYPSIQAWTPNYGVVPQMGDALQRNDCRLDSVQGMSTPMDQIDASSKCVGERIRSFRTLLKAYGSINPTVAETANGFWTVMPFYCPVRFESGTPVEAPYTADLYTTLHGCFLYVRGGVRWAFHNQDVLTDPVNKSSDGLITVTREAISVSPAYIAAGVAGIAGLITRKTANGLKVIGSNVDNQPVQVSVPALGGKVARLCNEHLATTSVLLRINTGAPAYVADSDVLTIGPTSASAPYNRAFIKYRAGADDCNFSYFISVMPMTRSLGI